MRNFGVSVSERWLKARKALGITGSLIFLFHILMSVLFFRAAAHPQFFVDDGALTLAGGLSMLGGVAAFVALWAYTISFQTFLRKDSAFIGIITSRIFLLFGLSLGAAHLFFMGCAVWLTTGNWHGGLPPVSLIAFVVFVAGFVVNVLGREKQSSGQSLISGASILAVGICVELLVSNRLSPGVARSAKTRAKHLSLR